MMTLRIKCHDNSVRILNMQRKIPYAECEEVARDIEGANFKSVSVVG